MNNDKGKSLPLWIDIQFNKYFNLKMGKLFKMKLVNHQNYYSYIIFFKNT